MLTTWHNRGNPNVPPLPVARFLLAAFALVLSVVPALAISPIVFRYAPWARAYAIMPIFGFMIVLMGGPLYASILLLRGRRGSTAGIGILITFFSWLTRVTRPFRFLVGSNSLIDITDNGINIFQRYILRWHY